MLKDITNRLKIQKAIPFEFYIEKNLKEKIDLYWNNYIDENPEYYDADILMVTDFNLENDILKVSKAKFSDVFYSAKKGELITRNLFSAIFFKTLDDFYVIIKNTYDERINLIGGMAEIIDFDNEYLDYEKCLAREIEEEIGLDLYNKNEILSYELKYIKIPDDEKNDVFYPCGICYIGTLNFTADGFRKYINLNIKKFDGEVKEFLFLTKDECLNLEFKHSDRTYIKDLFEAEFCSKGR